MATRTTPDNISMQLSVEQLSPTMLLIYRTADRRDYAVYQTRLADNTAEILDIKVMSQRGVGIGSSLLQKCVEIAGAQFHSSLFALCRVDNVLAHHFYQKNQFCNVAMIPNIYGLGNHATVFTHCLSSLRGL